MQPRWYQTESVTATWDYIRTKPGNPCIELPTGAGKSLVIGMIIRDILAWNGRALVLAHRKELVEQNAEKCSALLPGLDVGLYAASLKRKDHHQAIVCGQIQSSYKKKACLNLGHRDVVLIDEAHLIPNDGDGMYLQALEHLRQVNPALRVVGLTATPYRLDSGLVCGPDRVLTEICYQVPLLRLIEEGYLCPLTSKDPSHKMDTQGVGLNGGEFIRSQLDDHAAHEEVVRAAVLELLSWTHDRHSCLIFCCGKKHAAMVRDFLGEQVPRDQVAYVDGDSSPGERASILDRFKAQQIRYLVNIDVLTTGFDAPNVDAVGLLRPTMSPGLLYQMIGRGLRLHPSKQNCLILDFAGNIERHGPVDQLRPPKLKTSGSGGGTPGEAPTRSCPQCKEIVAIQVRECPSCGYQWPAAEAKHEAEASDLPVLSNGKPLVTTEWVEVHGQAFTVYSGKGPDASRTLRVTYKLAGVTAVSEYICLEHPEGNYGRKKAQQWWRSRSPVPCPTSVWQAYWLLKDLPDLLAMPARMELRWTQGKRWPEIIRVEMGPMPDVDWSKYEEAVENCQVKENLFR